MNCASESEAAISQRQAKQGASCVYIVEDDIAMRDSVGSLLSGIGFRVESYPTGQAFIEAYSGLHPCCIVLDLRLPDMSGLKIIEQITKDHSRCPPAIIITGFGEVSTATAAFKSGAVDYLEKPFPPQTLIDQVTEAMRQDRKVYQEQAEKVRMVARLSCLTDRERQVLEMLMKGMSNKRIAYELDISEKTVGSHKAHILSKTESSSLLDLANIFL